MMIGARAVNLFKSTRVPVNILNGYPGTRLITTTSLPSQPLHKITYILKLLSMRTISRSSHHRYASSCKNLVVNTAYYDEEYTIKTRKIDNGYSRKQRGQENSQRKSRKTTREM